MTEKTQDLNVLEFEPLTPPEDLANKYSPSEQVKRVVLQSRAEFRDALYGRDKRMVIITGPCSIHQEKSAMEYAEKLCKLREKVKHKFQVIMRVYFEKPRTTVGWKGLINDPHLDGTYDIISGLSLARKILLQINEMGLPCATEFLDPITPQYTSDLITWTAIGARTTESQTHRQMASGLSMPVGFKNATNGSLQVAIDAMVSAQASHAFLGIDDQGKTSIIKTRGNPDVHVVLRGSSKGPNYKKADIAYTNVHLESFAELQRMIMIDCSHGNSSKDYTRQPKVFTDIIDQFNGGTKQILGVMLESHLKSGNQKISKNMTYGQSITDGCIDWETTESSILRAADSLLL